MTAGLAAAALVVAIAGWLRWRGRWRRAGIARARLVVDGVPGRRASASSLGRAPQWFERTVVGLGIDEVVDPDALWRTSAVGAGPVVVAGVVVFGPVPTVVLVGAVLLGPHLVGPWLRDRLERRIDAQLPTFLDAVASGLRSGSSLSVAVLEAADHVPSPLHRRLAPVVAATRAGAPLDAELWRWLDRQDSSSVRLVVAALGLGLGAGGPQADTIDAIGDTLRDRLAVAGEMRALAAQARASAVVIVVAPVAFAVVAAIADPSVLHFLIGSPGGAACLVCGVALDGLGAAWMGAITRAAR